MGDVLPLASVGFDQLFIESFPVSTTGSFVRLFALFCP